MSNPNSAFGLRPFRHRRGGIIRLEHCTIADQYGTDLFVGDPVLKTGTGLNIGIATAGSSGKVSGVFAGCRYVASNGETYWSNYWPASTVIKTGTVVDAMIWEDPDIIYEIQMDTLAEADVGRLTNLVSGSGSTLRGLSGWSAAGVAGSEDQLKIIGLGSGSRMNSSNVQEQNAYGAYAVAQVMLATHEGLSEI